MNNKRKKAAALKYNQEQSGPQVAASGKGRIADTIIKKAKENNVPILEDPSLVDLLAELNINETIPEELYQAIAEVFAFVYRTDQTMQKSNERK